MANLFQLTFAQHFHGDIGEIADDRLHVTADVADLGEFGGFDFDEGSASQLCQAPGDFGFTDSSRADHQNVLGRYFLAQRIVQLDASPAVAQRDCHGSLGRVLADDVLVQFVHDLPGGHGHDGSMSRASMVRLWLV